jgi:hypothetical protein
MRISSELDFMQRPIRPRHAAICIAAINVRKALFPFLYDLSQAFQEFRWRTRPDAECPRPVWRIQCTLSAD